VPPSPLPPDIMEAAATWLQDRQKGMADDIAFRAWLAADSRHEEAWQRVQVAWQGVEVHATAPELLVMRKDAIARAYRHTQARWARAGGARALDRRAVVAAGLGLAATAAGAIFVLWRKPESHSFATQTGEQTRLTLSDGTRLTLDARSSLRTTFESDARTVDLHQGRAYFEVAKDASRPFRVRTDGHVVTAIGTAFSVESRAAALKVELYEGRVNVAEASTGDTTARSRDLEPMQSLVISGATPAAWRLASFDAQKDLAWRDGRLYFENTSLAEAVARMNDYSPTRLEVVGPAAGLKVSGMFIAGQTEAFVEALRATYPLQVRRRDQAVILRSRT